MSWARMGAVWVLSLAVVACAILAPVPGGGSPVGPVLPPQADEQAYLIRNGSYDAKEVRFYCGGGLWKVVRGLAVGNVEQGIFDRNCVQLVLVEVRYFGDVSWRSESFYLDRSLLTVDIGPRPAYNFWKTQ